MTEVEAKIEPAASKKQSRKSKAPVPLYRRESANGAEEASSAAAAAAAAAAAVTNSSMSVANLISTSAPTSSTTGAPIKSYSDFMRSLAAKYNNNE